MYVVITVLLFVIIVALLFATCYYVFTTSLLRVFTTFYNTCLLRAILCSYYVFTIVFTTFLIRVYFVYKLLKNVRECQRRSEKVLTKYGNV